MYRLLLITHYLRRRLIPLFAALGVCLCTAMVIIVMSVMGGFIGLMRGSAHKFSGDVIIERPEAGFAGYPTLLDELRKRPEVAAATPMIEAYALLEIGPKKQPVQVLGVDPASVGKVLSFEPQWDGAALAGARPWLPQEADAGDAGRRLQWPGPDGKPGPAAVIGIEVNPYHSRDEQGRYDPANAWVGKTLRLTLVPLTAEGRMGTFTPRTRELPVANEVRSGFYEADQNRVFVPFDWLQRELEMQESTVTAGFDPVTGEGGEAKRRPARATHVLVAAKPGHDLRAVVRAADEALRAAARRDDDILRQPPDDILPWHQQGKIHALLAAVENEKGMMTFLFAVIGVVAVMMVALTFYMIVLEKTRDIGILRTLGASRLGVMRLFVQYGLVVGIGGAAAGFLLAWFIVSHLNNLQQAMAWKMGTFVGANLLLVLAAAALALVFGLRARRRGAGLETGLGVLALALGLGVPLLYFGFPALCGLRTEAWAAFDHRVGWLMWNPRFYYFDSIPDRVDFVEAGIVALCAVVASTLGSIIPAAIAAAVNPVESLRHE